MVMEALAIANMGLSILGGINQKSAADRAAAAQQRIGEFNAKIIERDVGASASPSGGFGKAVPASAMLWA